MKRDKITASFFILIVCINDALVCANVQDDINNFNAVATRGNGAKEIDDIMAKPFDQMEEHLSAAPTALKILGQLCLVATNHDFRLDDDPTFKFELLRAPGSFRASLAQVTNESWSAFFTAHSAMYSIKLNTGMVKNHLGRALRYLFEGTIEEVEHDFPIALRRISEVADEATTEAQKVVDQFARVQAVISELKIAGIAKQGRTTLLEKETKNSRTIEIRREDEARKRLAENEKARSDLEIEIAKVTEQYNSALEDTEPDQVAQAFTLILGALGPTLNSIGTMAKTTKKRSKSNAKNAEKENTIGSSILQGLAGLANAGSKFLFDMNADKETVSEADIDSLILQQPKDEVNLEKEYANKHLATQIATFQSVILPMKNYFHQDGTIKSRQIDCSNGEKNDACAMIKILQAQKADIEELRSQQAHTGVVYKILAVIDRLIDITAKLKVAATQKGDKAVVPEYNEFKTQMNALSEIINIDVPLLSNNPTVQKQGPTMRNVNKRAAETDTDDDASKIKTAHMRLMTLKEQLNRAKESADQQSDRALELNDKLQLSLERLDKFDATTASLHETLQVLQEGLQALGALEREWKALLVFFDEMSRLIKAGIGKPLKNFVQHARSKADRRSEGIDIAEGVGKEIIYDIAYKASKTAFIVNRKADAYYQISKNHLMPQINKLGELIVMNPKTQMREMEAEKSRIDVATRNIQNAIKEIIKKSRSDYRATVDKKIAELEKAFDANVPDLPPIEKENLKNKVKRSADDIIDYSDIARR